MNLSLASMVATPVAVLPDNAIVPPIGDLPIDAIAWRDAQVPWPMEEVVANADLAELFERLPDQQTEAEPALADIDPQQVAAQMWGPSHAALMDEWVQGFGEVRAPSMAVPSVLALSSPAQPSQPVTMVRRVALANDHAPLAVAPSLLVDTVARQEQAAYPVMQAWTARVVTQPQQGGDHAEPLLAAPMARAVSTDAATSTPATLTQAMPQTTSLETASAKQMPVPVANTPEQKLLGALGERISVQAGQGIQSAVIRLDPHLSGSVRIELRHEVGAMHVRISASQAEVAQQLQVISDSLRQELNSRQFNDVTVQISHGRHADHGERGGQQQGRDGDSSPQQTPGRALAADATDEGFDAAWKRATESRGDRA
ncbi:flagellar hook-length control protein FliK [Dyella sp. M7H15-1]|uniref:flagellar hook-length control protein FliK n=1 Tax=Dyella sp. M7H15-1 TaxID=2501295 RepID=UPI0010050A33|nr:flagellar hook-length control protein FliK [Dyella sp. M7H15-1]QAU24294.1 flagellar hook-length control protein FliK [Dyella sp. M7H15-1]